MPVTPKSKIAIDFGNLVDKWEQEDYAGEDLREAYAKFLDANRPGIEKHYGSVEAFAKDVGSDNDVMESHSDGLLQEANEIDSGESPYAPPVDYDRDSANADKASEKANKSGDRADHARAATLHDRASDAAQEQADSDNADDPDQMRRNARAHSAAAANHAEKASGQSQEAKTEPMEKLADAKSVVSNLHDSAKGLVDAVKQHGFDNEGHANTASSLRASVREVSPDAEHGPGWPAASDKALKVRSQQLIDHLHRSGALDKNHNLAHAAAKMSDAMDKHDELDPDRKDRQTRQGPKGGSYYTTASGAKIYIRK